MRDDLLDAQAAGDDVATAPNKDEEAQQRVRDYHEALGAFVDTFANVETAMHIALRWHTKTTLPTARAVFSGTRPDTAAQFFNRMAEVGIIGSTEWAEFKPVIEQLMKINGARNLILHHGATAIREGRGFVTDAVRALTFNRIKYIPISPEILRYMTRDLLKIFVRLGIRHSGHPQSHDPSDPVVHDMLHGAWQYTPSAPPQTPKEGKARGTRKARRRSAQPNRNHLRRDSDRHTLENCKSTNRRKQKKVC